MSFKRLHEFEDSLFYIGNIVSINYESYNITFKIPGIFDNLQKYPTAYPCFPHTYELMEGENVLILKMSKIDNQSYFYFPITILHKIGLFYFNNIIDVSTDGLIRIESPNVKINGGSTIELSSGGAKLSMGSGGDITIYGNVTVEGNLSYSGGFNGEISTNNGNFKVDGGIIKGA